MIEAKWTLVMAMVMLLDAVCCGHNLTQNDSDRFALHHKQSRQYSSSHPSYAATSPSLFSNPVEAIVIGVLAVFGLSLFGIPLLLMLMSMFNMNASPGVSLIPTATTSVNSGRRKRRSPPNVDHLLFSKIADSFTTFINSEEKMRLLQDMIS